METLGDLSLAADVDPQGAAVFLRQSRAQEDVDTMLALLRAEERQNTRSDHGPSGEGEGGDAGDGGETEGGRGDSSGLSQDLLATPCLEFFLEERIVKVLCELGAADHPKGTMALVLGACASLLGQVGWDEMGETFNIDRGLYSLVTFVCRVVSRRIGHSAKIAAQHVFQMRHMFSFTVRYQHNFSRV